jgi:hypothetical protein
MVRVIAWHILIIYEMMYVKKDTIRFERVESCLYFLMLVDNVCLFIVLSLLKNGVGVWYCRCTQHSSIHILCLWHRKLEYTAKLIIYQAYIHGLMRLNERTMVLNLPEICHIMNWVLLAQDSTVLLWWW